MSLYTNEDQTSVEDPAVETSASQEPNAVDQLLAGIKNEEGKQKYANVEDAIKALQHSQQFINTLKSEKEQLAATLKSQEQLAEMLNKKEVSVEQTKVAESVQSNNPGLTPEQVLEIVEQRETAKVHNSNIASVKAALETKYGAEYKSILANATRDKGLSPELVDQIAKTSPQAALDLLGLSNTQVKKPGVASSVSTTDFKDAPKEKAKFNPFAHKPTDTVSKWKASAERTNTRLGLNK